MKNSGIIRTLLLGLLLIVLAGVTGCGGGEKEAPQSPGEINGNPEVSVTGEGNLAATAHTKLTFSSGGKVYKVLVKAGDEVAEGDVLASLDTSTLELAEAQAQVVITRAQLAQHTAEQSLLSVQDPAGTLALAVGNAQIAVKTAQFNLEKTTDLYTWSDIKTAKADVDDARRYLDTQLERAGALTTQSEDGTYPGILEYALSDDFIKTPVYEGWQRELVHAQARLNTAEARLDAMLSGSDPEEIAIKKLQLKAAEKAVAQAQQKLSDESTIKTLEVASAKETVNLAQMSLDQARRNLGEASIMAPFDGIVVSVGVKEGDFLSPAAIATTIVEIIDLKEMELTVRIDEIDVVKVKVGQPVLISVDALPEAKLEGRVSFISPVAWEAGGVVLFESDDEEKTYAVKIDFQVPGGLPVRAGMSATAEIIIK